MRSSTARFVTAAAYAAASLVSVAQTSTGTTAHRSPSSSAAAHRPGATRVPGCAAVPTLSPKIPTLPAGTPCPKVLYRITSSASDLSPQLSAALKESLEKLNQSFYMAYVDTRVGTGAAAQPRMYYTVNYTGYLLDGTKFDSSEGKDPITFPYGAHRVIQGWDTGFEGMHVGGKRRLYIPYQLAYGEAGKPPVIPAKSELVFDVELVAQSDKPPTPKTPPTPPAGAPGADGAGGSSGTVPPAGAQTTPQTEPRTAPTATPGAAGQPASKPSTPPVTSTTPATPPSPTGSTTPKP